MFNLEFMTGAASFAALNFLMFLLVLVVGLFIVYQFLTVTWVSTINHYEKTGKFKIIGKRYIIFLILFAGSLLFFGSNVQPKVAIKTPVNRELMEYQEKNEPVVIVTPKPRTQNLNGFSPLKEGN
jgi:hypothetical protein